MTVFSETVSGSRYFLRDIHCHVLPPIFEEASGLSSFSSRDRGYSSELSIFMVGARRKMREVHFRNSYSYKVLSPEVSCAELPTKSLHESLLFHGRNIEIFATLPEHSSSAEELNRESEGMRQDQPLYFDPLLPKCRHDNSHVIPLRKLRKHEVWCPEF